MKKPGLLSLILFLMLSLLAFTSADLFQEKETIKSTLIGKVIDSKTGKTLSKVNIMLWNTKREAQTLSSPNGKFKIGALEPGRYTLLVTSITFQK